MLRFDAVTKIFSLEKNSWTFGPISLSFRENEFLAIVGKSGSGKSTLLHMAGGLLSPDFGKIFFMDRDITRLSETEKGIFRNQHIGFVFQDFFLFQEFSLLENVAMPLFVRGVSRFEALEKAEYALSEVGLSTRKKHYPSELSGGQRQRAAIARAIVGNPEILLADEPTGSLDGETGKTILSLLKKLQKNHGTTLIIVTHDEELARRADRIVIIEDGKVKS